MRINFNLCVVHVLTILAVVWNAVGLKFSEDGASTGVCEGGSVHCGCEGEVGKICVGCGPWLPLHAMVLWFQCCWAFVSSGAAA